jgi:hypothetical protein
LAAGPIYPCSAFPFDTGAGGRTFPNYYVGTNQGGTANNAPQDEGLGWAASISTDDLAGWSLRFDMPPTQPTGTMKIHGKLLANATSGTAKLTVADGVAAPSGGIPSGVTLTSETQVSVTWAAGSEDAYQEVKVTLSSAWQANGVLVVSIVANHTSYTLAQVLTAIVSLIWE